MPRASSLVHAFFLTSNLLMSPKEYSLPTDDPPNMIRLSCIYKGQNKVIFEIRKIEDMDTYIDAGVRVSGLRIVGFNFIPPVQRLSLRLIQVKGR